MNSFEPKNYPELLKAIERNDLIVFVGAGLSWNFENVLGTQLKGWDNLVKNVLEHLKVEGFDVDHLLPLVDKIDPITVLDIIEKDPNLSRAKIQDFLKQFLDLKEDSDFSLHKNLFQLSRKIITTNYDDAFERSSRELFKNVAFKGKNYELTKHKEEHSALLFKLHGCFLTADSMVLFPSNYKDLYQNEDMDAKHSLQVLRNIIQNKTVLFIGCGMGDFQINSIFKEIKSIQGLYHQKHYILSTQPLDSQLDFLTRIPLANHGQIPEVIESLNGIKAEFRDRKSPEQQRLEQQLTETQRELENFKENSEKKLSRQEFLLKREALKYYEKGISFHIADDFTSANEQYEVSCELDDQNASAFFSWGTSLGSLARTQLQKEAETSLLAACDKYEKSIALHPNDPDVYNNWGTDLGDMAKFQEGEQALKTYQEANSKFDLATQIDPNHQDAYFNWGTYLGNMARTQSKEEAESTYQEAFEKFQKAIQIKPDDAEAYNNWGFHLGRLALTQPSDKALSIYKEAVGKFATALEINPTNKHSYTNWGHNLAYMAPILPPDEILNCYQEAFAKYEKATQINPSDEEAYHNWGIHLGNAAKHQPEEQVQATYQESLEKFRKATILNPNKPEIYHNWAIYLANSGNSRTGDPAVVLYQEAIEKYQKAIDLNPDDYNSRIHQGIVLEKLSTFQSPEEAEKSLNKASTKYQEATKIKPALDRAYYVWSALLSKIAKYKSGEEAKQLLEQSLEQALKAHELGGNCYNLACSYALMNQKADALSFLRTSLESNEIGVEYVKKDSDWELLQNDEDFKSLIASFQQ